MVEDVITIFKETICFGKILIECISNNKKKKNELTELLKKIILGQRHLKYISKSDYSVDEIIDYENEIVDILKILFDEELSNCFVINAKNIYWAIRYKSDIPDILVEEALEPFILLAKKKGYKI